MDNTAIVLGALGSLSGVIALLKVFYDSGRQREKIERAVADVEKLDAKIEKVHETFVDWLKMK